MRGLLYKRNDPRQMSTDPFIAYESVPWHAAACKGINTEMFFVDPSEAMGINPQLRKICSTCPILEECREYSIWMEWEGFWGGLAAHERYKLRAKLRNRGIRRAS